MSDSEEEEEEEALLLDPDAIDQIARRQFGYRPTGWCHHGPKCNRAHCMTADNPAHRMFKNIEKEGGTRVEVDCQKGILVIRLTVPHKSTGKTEMTKVNVDYPAIALAFEDPALCFLNNIVRPPKTGIGFGSQTSKSKESYDVERPWSLTPFQPERSPERPKGGVEEGRRERRRRLALPGHGYVEVEQEISLGAKGHYDRDRHGRIKPWKMLRDKKVWDQEEEEKKEEFVRKVAKALKAKAGEGGDEEGGGEAAAGGSGQGGSVSVSVYGPALPGNLRAPVELERWQKSAESLPAGVFSTAGKKQAAAGLEIRQCTGEVPSGTRPDRYRGRFFKEPAVPAAEETPSLAPTAAVADFKRRRQETAAERLARKASKSHKQNLEEYNELMEKIPAHSEQRKINWYKF